MIRNVARLVIVCLVCLTGLVFGQHPLVGSWKMISIKGKGADGEPFSFDTTSVREIKVITPTHYMLMAYSVDGDSLIFNRAYAGTIAIKGEHYLEKPELSSLPIFDNVSSDFTWRLEGNRFIQSGSFVRPDGKKILLDELIFEKIMRVPSHSSKAVGTWSLVSSMLREGIDSVSENSTGIQLITPTHWMQLVYKDGKFNEALMGTYNLKNEKIYPNVIFASGSTTGYKLLEISIDKKGRMTEKTEAHNFSRQQIFEKK